MKNEDIDFTGFAIAEVRQLMNKCLAQLNQPTIPDVAHAFVKRGVHHYPVGDDYIVENGEFVQFIDGPDVSENWCQEKEKWL